MAALRLRALAGSLKELSFLGKSGKLSLSLSPSRSHSIGSTHSPEDTSIEKKELSKTSRRAGLIGIKLGMTQLWNKEGGSIPVTVLQVIDNQVVSQLTKEKNGYDALQIGAINHNKEKNMCLAQRGHFRSAGVPPKRALVEFKVTSDALLPVGTQLDATHFVPGQYVDVCAKSIGKGFQGVMKRHHMSGGPASHGATKFHRKMGSSGGGHDPGRVFPGKKMPGRMGGKRVTTKCVKIHRVNHAHNVIYLNGPVPGHKNTVVRISDAKLKPVFDDAPFPTYIPDPSLPLPEEVYSAVVHVPHEGTIVFPDKRKKKNKAR